MNSFFKTIDIVDKFDSALLTVILIFIGVGGLYKIWKHIDDLLAKIISRFNQRKKKKASKRAFRNSARLYDLLQELALGYKCKWALITSVSNGGDWISELSEKYLSVIYEVKGKAGVPFIADHFRKVRMDGDMLRLHEHAQRYGLKGYPREKSIPEESSIRFLYQEYNIKSSYTFYIKGIEKRFYFLALSFDRETPLTNAELFKIQYYYLNKIKAILPDG